MRSLQQERGLADAGITADQGKRPRNDPAAEHAVQFADLGADPRIAGALYFVDRPRFLLTRNRGTSPAKPSSALASSFDMFCHRIPGMTARAFPHPLWRFIPALITDKFRFYFTHSYVFSVV